MKYVNFELSERDIITILNSLSYFRSEIMEHPDVKQKERVSMHFNFKNHEEFVKQYDLLVLLHRRISTQANSEIYNIKNDIFFKGQQDYFLNDKKYDFLYDDKRYELRNCNDNNINIIKIPYKNNKYFLRKFIDKFKKIV